MHFIRFKMVPLHVDISIIFNSSSKICKVVKSCLIITILVYSFRKKKHFG